MDFVSVITGLKAKMLFFPLVTFCVLLLGCAERSYFTVEFDNPVYKPNKVFESFEDMGSPKASYLITKYRLDTVVNGEADEFKRIMLLRHWIKSVIPILDFAPHYPGGGQVEGILDHALQGQGYDCGAYMKVQNAIMSAFGYVTRTLGAGASVKGVRDGHHGINEIWLNQYNKWFLSDAKYDHHFEKDGIPLSALEVRNEWIRNQADDILMVVGPDRTPLEFDEEMQRTRPEHAQTYTWVSWDAWNDIHTRWIGPRTSLLMFDDDYYKTNTWYRGGKPHWAYNTDYLTEVQQPDELYFTPNTIASQVMINGKVARIKLVSDTPSLKEYQMKKLSGDKWVKVEPEFEIDLKNRRYEWVFRAVNVAGVSGPEHRITIDSNRI
jgi:hypothetical protein